MNFIQAHSNNFEVGRRGNVPMMIVIHSIVGTAQSCINTFKSPARKASAHYVVAWNGEITQMVKDTDTAYHAGVFEVNLRSIGIEHDDLGKRDIKRPDELYHTSAKLVAELCTKYSIPCTREYIKKHSEIKPTACPAGLDIDRIVREAQAIMNPTPQPSTEYPIGVVTADNGLNVRVTPSLSTQAVMTFKKGQEFAIEGVVTGDAVLGNNQWLKVAGKNWYVWSGSVAKKEVPPPVMPAPTTTLLSENQLNAVKVLNEALTKLTSKNGTAFGNEEGMAREMVDSWNEYLQLKQVTIEKQGLLTKLSKLLGLS